jgi:hypothetical protein
MHSERDRDADVALVLYVSGVSGSNCCRPAAYYSDTWN